MRANVEGGGSGMERVAVGWRGQQRDGEGSSRTERVAAGWRGPAAAGWRGWQQQDGEGNSSGTSDREGSCGGSRM